MKLLAKPIPVPATSIYTRSDGVVAWQACLEEEGPRRENIEVRTTHIGLGFHLPALWAIADRLSQPIGEWRPFRKPTGCRLLPRIEINLSNRDVAPASTGED